MNTNNAGQKKWQGKYILLARKTWDVYDIAWGATGGDMRLLLAAMHAVFLGLGYFAAAALVAPFTGDGLVGTPSRMGVAVFVVTRMPLDGPTLLTIIRPLLSVPLAALVLVFLAGFPSLRGLRWLGAGISLAGLGYLLYIFPGVLSFKAVPWPLMMTALLFSGSTLLFLLLPEHTDATFTRNFTQAMQGVLWVGTVGFLWYGALRQNLPLESLAVAALCTAGYSLAFYSLFRAIWGKATCMEPVVWGMVAMTLAGLAWYLSPPMAFPLFGGIALWLTAALPS